MRILTGWILLFFGLLLTPYSVSSEPKVVTVHVVTTQLIPKSLRLQKKLAHYLTGLEVRNWDMAGKSGTSILGKLKQEVAQHDVFVAVGSPATRFVTDNFTSHSVVSAYSLSDSLADLKHPQTLIVESSPSLEQLAEAFREIWPEVETLAAFTTQDVPNEPSGIKLIKVSSAKDICNAIEQGDAGGYVFPREASLLNRSTIKEVVGHLNKVKAPAVGYSKFLVGTGFPAAYVVDEASYGLQVAQTVGNLVHLEIEGASNEGTIWVSKKSAAKFGIALDHARTIGELL